MKLLFMQMPLSRKSYFLFDLDDTLFYEIDYLHSAYREIAGWLQPLLGENIYTDMLQKYTAGQNTFEWIIQAYGNRLPGLSVQQLIAQYHNHFPDVAMKEDAAAFLERLAGLSIPAGILTDGRSITQRNKLRALGLDNYFRDIIISEEFGTAKPNYKNYLYFQNKYADRKFYCFADNTSKDFQVPRQLGWITVCVKDCGKHIHRQSFNEVTPHYVISSFDEIQLELEMAADY